MKNKKYPPYSVDRVNSLKELLNLAAKKYGDNPAFTFEREGTTIRVSYKRFQSDVEGLGAALFDLDIQDAKIALIGENSYEWIVSYFSAVNGGNTIIPLDKELKPADLAALLVDCQASVLIYSDDYKDIADGLVDERLNIRQKLSIQRDITALVQKGRDLAKTDKAFVDYNVASERLSTIIYTSGTTGPPKGVMLSHKNIASNVSISLKNCILFGVGLLVLPLHHSFSFTAAVLCELHCGCNIVINRSLKEVAADLVKYKPNNILLVPLFVETLYKKVWDTAKKTGKDGLLKALVKISNALLKVGIDLRAKLFKQVLAAFGGEIDVIITGGAPIDTALIKGFRDLGLKVLNGYGISECSPIVSITRNQYYRDGSVGLVIPDIGVKIIDPDEHGQGEICVKGDIVMLGYYENEQATADAFDGEWFKTGDIGHLDKDGFLFISGRKKNLIILSNGKNVSPEELELEILNQIPYIKEAVVYAEGNTIVAEVFLDIENVPDCAKLLDADILKLNGILPVFKNIGKTVIRQTEFPKTTTKKIKRQYKKEDKS